MKFGPVPLEAAAGAILGHNVSDADGRRRLRKGRPLREADVELLRELGRTEVWAARPEEGDIDEDRAAARIAEALIAPTGADELGLERSGPRTGRLNLQSTRLGVLIVDQQQIDAVNRTDGVTFATRRCHAVVAAGTTVGTLKILPYFVPGAVLARACEAVEQQPSAVRVRPLEPRRVGLVVHGHRGGEEKTVKTFANSLRRRLEQWNATLPQVDFVASDVSDPVRDLARAIEHATESVDLVLLAGDTAVQDRHDIAPSAIERAGGEVHCFGAPVDPGNLLLLGRCGETTVFGVPGCARSPKRNVVDLLLPRLLVGEDIGEREILCLGAGGLLEDVAERPYPRHKI